MTPNIQSGNLVYIGQGYTTVLVYSFNGKQVGQLTGLNRTGAICSDSQGNVWVGYGDSLLEYSHGGTIPIAQLYLQSRYYPLSCAVDPTTGDIAVTEVGYGRDNLAVYQNIYEPPQIYTDADFDDYTYVGYDDSGNLFLNGSGSFKHQVPVFAELVKGSGSLTTLSFDETFREIGGLQWNGQYLALGDDGNHVVYQFSVSNGRGTTQSTTHFHNWPRRYKPIIPFAIQDGIIVFAFNSSKVGYFDFPQGGRPVHLINLSSAAGITISVPPSRRRGGRK